MRYYYFVTEGVHDLAVISKILKLMKFNQVNTKEDLPNIWKELVPISLKIPENSISRVNIDLPKFYKNNETDCCIAIKVAGNDTKLFGTIDDTLSALRASNLSLINGISVFCDADTLNARGKITKLISDTIEQDKSFEFDIENYSTGMITFRGFNIKTGYYVFPDSTNTGVLEDILIDAGKNTYPVPLESAADYIDAMDGKHCKKLSDSHRKKAVIGCVTNLFRPGL